MDFVHARTANIRRTGWVLKIIEGLLMAKRGRFSRVPRYSVSCCTVRQRFAQLRYGQLIGWRLSSTWTDIRQRTPYTKNSMLCIRRPWRAKTRPPPGILWYIGWRIRTDTGCACCLSMGGTNGFMWPTHSQANLNYVGYRHSCPSTACGRGRQGTPYSKTMNSVFILRRPWAGQQ